MKKLLAVVSIILVFMSSCSSQTEPINYGKDNCSLCRMTIMEKEYACELVTKKGKVFKFDDISCLVKYIKSSQTTEADYSFLVVNDFKRTNQFIDVREALFVSGDDFRSPMRGDLAAFANIQEVEAEKKKNAGITILSWKQVLEKFQ
ncbi:nitrous oxide reductase accessory protein NosL [Emticicia sp. TH156]|uniref:nitrous oxide reductase accessory protein NosL n=1 Tax=Emticicia sp. TH156 TaxID=2067454 RepID=UPI001C1FC456|nr:nitrous oxide reductase accessory protein NosL [Emticicia sp. TH156]